ncbi:MAG: VanZ family protein [Chloroflexi bacterium]|nr:VanZ family protein [Chloroflexota bacterium]
MALIYWLSSQPQLPRFPEPLWHTLLAKTAHLGEYAVLAGLLLFALRERRDDAGARSPRPYRRWSSAAQRLALALALLYAVSDEFHQSFVPNRTASVWDVVIDGCGVLVTVRVAARFQTGRLNNARNAGG